MREEKRDILAGKSRILTGTEVHNQTAKDKEASNSKSGDNAQFL